MLTLLSGVAGLVGCHRDVGTNPELDATHAGGPSCLEAACHPDFQAAGSLFRDLGGEQPLAGVALSVIGEGGERSLGTSSEAGLFYAEVVALAGTVEFVAGGVRSESHQLPADAGCNTCHQAHARGGAPGALVGVDVFAPELEQVSPADGAVGVDPGAGLELRFSEPLDPASVGEGTIRLDGGGGSIPLDLVAASDSATVLALPLQELESGVEHTLIVERGLLDAAGNGLESQVQVVFTTASDGNPRVVGAQPHDGAVGVDPAEALVVWVSPELEAASVSAQSVSLSAGCDLGGSVVIYDPVEGAIGVEPLLDLPAGASCELELSGLVTLDGVAQEGPWTVRFDTWPDTAAPGVEAWVPGPERDGVGTLARVQILFDEPLDPGRLDPQALRVETADGTPLAGAVSLEGGERVLSWDPDEPLPASTWIVVTLVEPPWDLADNRSSGLAPWSFHTSGGPDGLGLRITSSTPVADSVAVPIDTPLQLGLSEDPDLTSLIEGAISLRLAQATQPVTLAYDSRQGRVAVTSLLPLAEETNYILRVETTLTDLSGNPGEAVALVAFETATTRDLEAPTFAGLVSVESADRDAVLLHWEPGSDRDTPASSLLYRAYLSERSGEQDLESPTATSAPGATELTVTGLGGATSYYAIVRAEDADGHQDGNLEERVGATLTSFSEDILGILDDACARCHSGNNPDGDMDVTTYESLLEADVVVPYDSDASELVTKGNHRGSGWFSESQESAVRAWIDAGALND